MVLGATKLPAQVGAFAATLRLGSAPLEYICTHEYAWKDRKVDTYSGTDYTQQNLQASFHQGHLQSCSVCTLRRTIVGTIN